MQLGKLAYIQAHQRHSCKTAPIDHQWRQIVNVASQNRAIAATATLTSSGCSAFSVVRTFAAGHLRRRQRGKIAGRNPRRNFPATRCCSNSQMIGGACLNASFIGDDLWWNSHRLAIGWIRCALVCGCQSDCRRRSRVAALIIGTRRSRACRRDSPRGAFRRASIPSSRLGARRLL